MPPHTRPTIVDVARTAGVSPTTVSYVLSGPKRHAARISEETTSRILQAVDELGYVPNQSARTLRLQRTNRILFLAGRFTSLYSQTMATSIQQGLAKHGLECSVQIGSTLDQVRHAITTLEQRQADGLIVEASDEAIPLLRAAATDGHAIVSIGPAVAQSHVDVMLVDENPAIEAAMQHLIKRGYPQFLLLSSLPTTLEEHRIATAYKCLQDLGMPKSAISLQYCPHDRIAAHELALELVPNLPRPLAIYAGSDVSAIGILWACHRLHLRVPQDVGIIGHGNTSETGITYPKLTSLGPVHRDFSKAADLMASRIKDPSLDGRQVYEPCRLSVRESS